MFGLSDWRRSDSEYAAFAARYAEAAALLVGRDAAQRACVAQLESALEMVALSGVEDALQDGVKGARSNPENSWNFSCHFRLFYIYLVSVSLALECNVFEISRQFHLVTYSSLSSSSSSLWSDRGTRDTAPGQCESLDADWRQG